MPVNPLYCISCFSFHLHSGLFSSVKHNTTLPAGASRPAAELINKVSGLCECEKQNNFFLSEDIFAGPRMFYVVVEVILYHWSKDMLVCKHSTNSY